MDRPEDYWDEVSGTTNSTTRAQQQQPRPQPQLQPQLQLQPQPRPRSTPKSFPAAASKPALVRASGSAKITGGSGGSGGSSNASARSPPTPRGSGYPAKHPIRRDARGAAPPAAGSAAGSTRGDRAASEVGGRREGYAGGRGSHGGDEGDEGDGGDEGDDGYAGPSPDSVCMQIPCDLLDRCDEPRWPRWVEKDYNRRMVEGFLARVPEGEAMRAGGVVMRRAGGWWKIERTSPDEGSRASRRTGGQQRRRQRRWRPVRSRRGGRPRWPHRSEGEGECNGGAGGGGDGDGRREEDEVEVVVDGEAEAEREREGEEGGDDEDDDEEEEEEEEEKEEEGMTEMVIPAREVERLLKKMLTDLATLPEGVATLGGGGSGVRGSIAGSAPPALRPQDSWAWTWARVLLDDQSEIDPRRCVRLFGLSRQCLSRLEALVRASAAAPSAVVTAASIPAELSRRAASLSDRMAGFRAALLRCHGGCAVQEGRERKANDEADEQALATACSDGGAEVRGPGDEQIAEGSRDLLRPGCRATASAASPAAAAGTHTTAKGMGRIRAGTLAGMKRAREEPRATQGAARGGAMPSGMGGAAVGADRQTRPRTLPSIGQRAAKRPRQDIGSRLAAGLREGRWKELLAAEFGKPYFREMEAYLEAERRQHGADRIYPPEGEIFNAFNLTPFEKVKVVIIGQDPYHNRGQAHGLAFSVRRGVAVPPSLKRVYEELERDLGPRAFRAPNHGCLESWAQQGVMLLNATLTVRDGAANSHQACGWQMFTDEAIRCLNEHPGGIVFMLWGSFAQRKASLIVAERHRVLKCPHPSPMTGDAWFGNKHFSKANMLLADMGRQPIRWNL